MDWGLYNRQHRKMKDVNYKRAMKTLDEAMTLAAANGFELVQHSVWHYSLTKGRWRWNLYPNNQRLYIDPHYENLFLAVASPWTFLDVVEAAIREVKRKEKNGS